MDFVKNNNNIEGINNNITISESISIYEIKKHINAIDIKRVIYFLSESVNLKKKNVSYVKKNATMIAEIKCM